MNIYYIVLLVVGISCSSIRPMLDEVIILTPSVIVLDSSAAVRRNVTDKGIIRPIADDYITIANVNDSVPAIAADGNATADNPDRGPISDFFQNFLPGIGNNANQRPDQQVSLDPPDDCEKCNCGIANKKNRIVGGHETTVNQYPWMGLMQYNGRFYCGCSLINDRYVLTAAHCVTGFRAERISVVLLDHNRGKPDETTTITRKVLRSVPHSGYSSSTYNNDIALLRLEKPVTFSSKIRPVCLPPRGRSFTGLKGIAAGWGALREGGSISETLQEVSVPILSNTECRKTGYGSSRITDNMMCAGITKGGKDSCQGDSGGPLHVYNNTLMHIVGVVSWGEGCAQPNYPGVYSRVNRYRTWIQSNTADACYCDENPTKK